MALQPHEIQSWGCRVEPGRKSSFPNTEICGMWKCYQWLQAGLYWGKSGA